MKLTRHGDKAEAERMWNKMRKELRKSNNKTIFIKNYLEELRYIRKKAKG